MEYFKMIKHIWLSLLIVLISALGITAQAATRITYLHHDNLGSPVAATDESGAVLWRETYAPFGDKSVKSESASNERIGYTGKLHDNDTGLTYLNARYYDPVVGRFMAVDPVGALTGGVTHFNRYSYAYNNPYKYTDPTGLLGMCGGACGDSPAGFDPETDWERTRLERANSDSALILGFTPFGTLLDIYSSITGFNPLLGQRLGILERALGLIPGFSEARNLYRGGSYYAVKGVTGNEAHHMPAKSVSHLSEGAGPAISMDARDHRDTASWGNSNAARAYRDRQRELVEQGRFREAQQMDIDDLREKFGNKYDDAISEMERYTDSLGL